MAADSAPNGNFFDLRGLGPNRTLILEDGRRVPATFFDGTVDTNILPQMLVQRVEVVTGGASAVYGSDAVTGVVNFILDRHLTASRRWRRAASPDMAMPSPSGSAWPAAKSCLIAPMRSGAWNITIVPPFPIRRRAPMAIWRRRSWAAARRPCPIACLWRAAQRRQLWRSCHQRAIQRPAVRGGGRTGALQSGHAHAHGGIAIGGDGGCSTTNICCRSSIQPRHSGGSIMNYPQTEWLSATQLCATRSYEANQTIANTASSYPITIYSGNAFLQPSQQAAADDNGHRSSPSTGSTMSFRAGWP